MSMSDADMRMQRAEELEESFSYDGYQVARGELFAHLRNPAVVIRKDSITFNTACINGLEDAVYIQILINKEEHRMAIRLSEADDKDSVRWCIEKPDKRKSRKITSKEFSRRIYEMMGWSEGCRYKILGHRICYGDEVLYVFELDETEIFKERKKKTKEQAKIEQEESGLTPEQYAEQEKKEKAMSRKPFYPDDWNNSFGVPVNEHKNASLETISGFETYAEMNNKRE